MRLHARRPATLLGLSAVWLLLLCGPALAHARLTEEYPAGGDTLAEPPEQVQLRFSEPVEAEFEPIEVYDEGGSRVDEGNARTAPDDRELLVVDLGELREDSYTVEWRVTSADGHPVSGEYGFDVIASAASANAGSPVAPVERSVEQEETGWSWSTILAATLGALLVGVVLAVAVLSLRKGRV